MWRGVKPKQGRAGALHQNIMRVYGKVILHITGNQAEHKTDFCRNAAQNKRNSGGVGGTRRAQALEGNGGDDESQNKRDGQGCNGGDHPSGDDGGGGSRLRQGRGGGGRLQRRRIDTR